MCVSMNIGVDTRALGITDAASSASTTAAQVVFV
jgi:hypothetical protein